MRQLFAILAVVLWAMTASSAAPRWESVDTPVEMEVISDQKSDDDASVEMAVKEGYVYIGSSRPVTVKVFTILGQLIGRHPPVAHDHPRGVYTQSRLPDTQGHYLIILPCGDVVTPPLLITTQ